MNPLNASSLSAIIEAGVLGDKSGTVLAVGCRITDAPKK